MWARTRPDISMYVCALLLRRSNQTNWDEIKSVNFVNQVFYFLNNGGIIIHNAIVCQPHRLDTCVISDAFQTLVF